LAVSTGVSFDVVCGFAGVVCEEEGAAGSGCDGFCVCPSGALCACVV